MNKRELVLFIFLSIITLGVYPFIVFNFKTPEASNKLSSSKKIVVNVKKLLELLKKDNISGTEYTHTKVKIFLKDVKKINPEEFKKMKGVSGVFVSNNSITLIVGNSAKELAAILTN